MARSIAVSASLRYLRAGQVRSKGDETSPVSTGGRDETCPISTGGRRWGPRRVRAARAEVARRASCGGAARRGRGAGSARLRRAPLSLSVRGEGRDASG